MKLKKQTLMNSLTIIFLGITTLFMANACNKSKPMDTVSEMPDPKEIIEDKNVVDEPVIIESSLEPVTENEPEITEPEPKAKITTALNEPKVVSLTVCSGVEQREPIDDLKKIKYSSGKIFSHTAIRSEKPDTIYHVYKFEDQEVARVELHIGASQRWRTWSTKTLYPSWIGNWSVEVESKSGAILAKKGFTVISKVEKQQEIKKSKTNLSKNEITSLK